MSVASQPPGGLRTVAFISFTLQMKSCGIFGLYPCLPLKWCLAVSSVSLLHRRCLFSANVQWRRTHTLTTEMQGWYQAVQHLLNSHGEREYENKYTKGTATEMVNIVFSMPHPNQK